MLKISDSTEVKDQFRFKKNSEGTIICKSGYTSDDSDYVTFFPNDNATFRGVKIVHDLTHQKAFDMLKEVSK